MKHIHTFVEFVSESLNEAGGYEKDKEFWDSLTAEEQALIMKDFGYPRNQSKKAYDGLHSDFYAELRNYLTGIKYDKRSLGKNPVRYA